MKIKFALLIIALSFSGQTWSETVFKEGTHYHRIQSETTQNKDRNKIQIKEFFWYGCHTCYSLQPYFEHWSATEESGIEFERVAAMTHDNMELLARSYYAAIKLNIENQIHIPLFTAIHGHKTEIENENQLTVFLKKQNINHSQFIKTMRSPEITQQIKRAKELGEQLEIPGPPTIAIGGLYRVDPSGVRSANEFIEVLNFLVNQIRKESLVK